MNKKKELKEQAIIFIKSLAMGTVNAIPGVSGGTIAMITGIFKRIIHSLKSFDITALQLLMKGKFRKFARHTDLIFILNVLLGNVVAIISLAKLFDFLFVKYPIYIWAYFFGLVLASVFFLGKTVTKWKPNTIIAFVIGTAIAVYVSFAKPGVENENFFYLMLCGAIAICCKILPGTSGAFVLLLMGNYHLIMIDSINHWRFEILIPFILGAVIGIIPFSHGLSWLLKRFHDTTTATLTGFILGSLGVLWPWKDKITQTFERNGVLKEVTTGFEWNLPQINAEFAIAVFWVVFGIATIYIIEWVATKIMKTSNDNLSL
jgi:putative membrane protein